MIDNNPNISAQASQGTEQSNHVQNQRERGVSTFKPLNFEQRASKNPGHDGCKVSPQQVEEAKATNNATNENAGAQKASGGNCPGGNLINQLLMQLLTTLQSVNIGR